MTDRAGLPENLERLLREVSNGYSGVLAEKLRAAIREALNEAEKRGRESVHNPSLDWALNSGDGVYRP